ncbi:MAG: hypothetical protein U0841_24785 [Chloroflexia bacterium]
MFGLMIRGYASSGRGGEDLAGGVDDAAARVGEAEGGEGGELSRLGELGGVGARAVHDGDAKAVQIGEVALRVEDGVGVAAQVGRGTDAVDDEAVGHAAVGGVEAVLVRQDARVGEATAVELGEEWREPLGVLVEDADRLAVHLFPPSISPSSIQVSNLHFADQESELSQ